MNHTCICHHTINTEPRAFRIHDIRDEAENIKTFIFKGTINSTPGQFCMLWLPQNNEKPFSIARDYDDEIWLTVSKVGPFTSELFSRKKGDIVGIRGAFGHGFTIENSKHIVLVGGGFGTAPLHFAGLEHKNNGCDVTLIIGARNKNLIIWENLAKNSGFNVEIATDDGSAGFHGFTTQVLDKILKEKKVDLVQTCGPEKMMKIIAQMCVDKKIPCEVSIERYMKCGFGVCGQCVTESGEKMCQIGPVVRGRKALTFEDFGVFHRGAEGQKIMW